MRTDARRNREQLLTAADAVFSEHGAEVSLEHIAKKAGVGIGTLYRHFPTREALLVATLHDSLLALAEKGRALLTERSAGKALETWIAAYVKHASTYARLSICLPKQPNGDSACVAVTAVGDALLQRAQAEGCVRDDVDFDDIQAMASAVAFAAEDATRSRKARMLAVFVDGLKAR